MPVFQFSIRLRAEKKQRQQRGVLEQFYASLKRIDGDAGRQLQGRHSPQTRSGHKSGFQTTLYSPPTDTSHAHNKSNTAAPISNTASDQGSTAPCARTANVTSAQIPTRMALIVAHRQEEEQRHHPHGAADLVVKANAGYPPKEDMN